MIENWSCDWPGHEGANAFHGKDCFFGCPTVMTCNWCVCEQCVNIMEALAAETHTDSDKDFTNDAENEDTFAPVITMQPAGTVSKYTSNDKYYCQVKCITVSAVRDTDAVTKEVSVHLTLDFNLRGDGSLGPLQDPAASTLHVSVDEDAEEIVFRPVSLVVYTRDVYQITGLLHYDIPPTACPSLFQKRVTFQCGSSGYSLALLVIPESTYRSDDRPICTRDHQMVMSDYCLEGYVTGYVCNKCRSLKKGTRWLCLQCHDDYCFDCSPASLLDPLCLRRHVMVHTFKKPPEYGGAPRCDCCKKEGLQTSDFYHCTPCGYDLCVSCAHKSVLADVA